MIEGIQCIMGLTVQIRPHSKTRSLVDFTNESKRFVVRVQQCVELEYARIHGRCSNKDYLIICV